MEVLVRGVELSRSHRILHRFLAASTRGHRLASLTTGRTGSVMTRPFLPHSTPSSLAVSVAAPATTLQCIPAQDLSTPRVGLYDVLEEIPAGTCLVVAAGGVPLAVLRADGARIAARRGAIGALVGRAVRDVRGPQALGLPVWSRTVHPLAYTRRLD